MPYFSLVIPTHNRPALLKMTLESVLNQTFDDFEVIVTDNSNPENYLKNKAIVNHLADKRIRHVLANHCPNARDNWAFGLNQASGKYQMLITDVSLLKPDCIKAVYDASQENPADIINFWAESFGYFPNSKHKPYRKSRSRPNKTETIIVYEPKTHLLKKASGEEYFRKKEPNLNRGYLVAGFYRKELVKRIIEVSGELFPPISPDTSCAALALCLAKSGITINQQLLLVNATKKGSTHNILHVPGGMRKYIQSIDPKMGCCQALPFKDLYTSLHNILTHDYLIVNRLGLANITPDLKKMFPFCVEDVARIKFKSRQEKKEQLDILKNSAKKLKLPFYRTYYQMKCYGIFYELAKKIIQHRMNPLNLVIYRYTDDLYS